MSSITEKIAASVGVSVEEAYLIYGVIDAMGSDALVPLLIERQVEEFEKDDLTSDEREWLTLFVQGESYRTLMETLFDKLGFRGTVELLGAISEDEDNDLNYYTLLTDEDPERIAAAYATEILERYVAY